MDFQSAIMRLDAFWAEHGCLIWHPHNEKVGAGTGNPATALRVLGPEPWNVGYLEPSVRPADGRYGENPNRWQEYYQYQVILKPDPGNPQEVYLDSLRALGVDTEKHDVRFVEDNWESPALGAWGLGWEVWLDGQEISQYTYFQQVGGLDVDPVAVEITYGLERIVMVLQDVQEFQAIRWFDDITYGQLRLRGEIEYCTYNFQVADVDALRHLFDEYEAEARRALDYGLALPAHDYVLRCSHTFNVLDARGAVGVTERARYFLRMRDLARSVAELYVSQREAMGYPLLRKGAESERVVAPLPRPVSPTGEGPHDLVLEIGSEELPVEDIDSGMRQLGDALREALRAARLNYRDLQVHGTPRRIVALVSDLASRQRELERVVKGPPARVAYDEDGRPTRAALGFARSQGVDPGDLRVQDFEGKGYVTAVTVEPGRETAQVLSELLPQVIGSLTFARSMRWNESGATYSRPLRWYVAVFGDVVVPFEYAGVRSGRVSRGIRSEGSPGLPVPTARAYPKVIRDAGILLDVEERERLVRDQGARLAAEVGGRVLEDSVLLREVANLVEYPLAIRGAFDTAFLRLPDMVLLAVMRDHQRYLPVTRDGTLLPYFIAVANGAGLDVDAVRHGNEEVLRARYADAAFFYDADIKKTLDEFTPRLATLTFQEQLGSVLDKVHRLERLAPAIARMLGATEEERETVRRAASLAKSDLATSMVIEHTSLQGQMGRHYAELMGEPPEVALAIEEHYLPRFAGDRLPESFAGVAVGLADRLDTLVGLFAVGSTPSGAADPWGLRRAALGLVQILLNKDLSLSIKESLALAAREQPVEVSRECLAEVHEFIERRLRGLLIDAELRYDVVDAVLAERGDNPARAYRTAQELASWVERDDWQELLDAYARCVRITRDEETIHTVVPERFVEPATRALYEAYRRVAARVAEDPELRTFMAGLQDLAPHIRRFFDDVLVMAEDPALRSNRLGLLQAIGALSKGIVDLRAMEGF